MSSLAAPVGFLLLSAPGLVYEAVREKCRPAIEHTPLREAGRVTLASVTFTGAASGLLALDRLAFPWMVPDPRQWATRAEYRTGHWLLATRTVVVGVALACVLAALVAWVLHRHAATSVLRRHAARMRPDPVLWLVTRKVQPRPSAAPPSVSVNVRLPSGEVYTGFLRGIDYTGDPGARMVALEAPLTRSGVPIGHHRLVLPLSQAEAITFTFHDAASVPARTHWCFRVRHR